MIKVTKDYIDSFRLEMMTQLLWIIEVNERSLFTSGHSDRVGSLSVLVGKKYKFPQSEMAVLYRAAILHDIGKMAIDSQILFSPFRLDEYEKAEMSQHALLGWEMLKRNHYLRYEGEIILQHHEHYDGGGYPSGLKGSKIHIFARIISTCDAFDALISPRSYKKGWEISRVVNLLKEQSGKMFDPLTVTRLLEVIRTENLKHIYPTLGVYEDSN